MLNGLALRMVATNFQRKLEEVSRRKGVHRMEVAPESLQQLRSLVSCRVEEVQLKKLDKRTLQTVAMMLQKLTSHPKEEKYKDISS